MEEFTKNTEQVLNYLSNKKACGTIVSATRSCYRQLGQYLTVNGLSYSKESAGHWIKIISEKYVEVTLSHYKNALLKLDDVYQYGEVRQATRFKSDSTYMEQLNEKLRLQLDEFLSAMSIGRSVSTLNHYKAEASRIFAVLQNLYGITDVKVITYHTVITFYTNDTQAGQFKKTYTNGVFAAILCHFHKQGLLPFGHTLMIHYLSFGKGCFWNRLSPSAMNEVMEVSVSICGQYSLEEYLSAQKEIVEVHIKAKYSKTIRTSYKKWMDLLYLFLDINTLPYTAETSRIWLREIKPYTGTEFLTARRALCLLEQRLTTGKSSLDETFFQKQNAFFRIADWCKPDVSAFLQRKAAEGWESSTLTMYRSSICRFCFFLDANGIRSFEQISPKDIKEFNRIDKHATPAGKNAYNIRIRKFLIYLGEENKLSHPMLFLALPSVSAPKETIVVTLTKDEIDMVKKAVHEDSGQLTLRKKAMLLLGLRMGIRSSDIVQLLLDDIDWDRVTLRFLQEKTDVEVLLPIPTDVANALYRYLIMERPETDCRTLFISERAPYHGIGRSACSRALESALPERNVPGSSFHVTRKTYATSLLSGGVGIRMVAEALGQTGTGTVHRYLSLDEERIRLCALSLEMEGLLMKGGFQ